MATKRQRYMIALDEEMFAAIEDFRFVHRYQTRSEATEELIRLGLSVVKQAKHTKHNFEKPLPKDT